MKYVKTYEGWRENLVAGMSLVGSMTMGQNVNAQTTHKEPQSTTQTQQKETQEQIKDRMSKSVGFGLGSSPSQSASMKIALVNAKSNLKKAGLTPGANVVEQHAFKNENGGFDYYVILSSL